MADNLATFTCLLSRNCGSLNLLEPYDLCRHVQGLEVYSTHTSVFILEVLGTKFSVLPMVRSLYAFVLQM